MPAKYQQRPAPNGAKEQYVRQHVSRGVGGDTREISDFPSARGPAGWPTGT